jgi:hypothetical protein
LKDRQEILALGQQLIKELELEPRGDTLGRWMAHHVAELIRQAEEASDASVRQQAEERAVETILRIWGRRSTVDRINPLKDLRPVLVALRTLTLDSPHWMFGSRQRTRSAYRHVHGLLVRLAICFLLLDAGGPEGLDDALDRAERAKDWQSDEEYEVVSYIAAWSEFTELLKQSDEEPKAATEDIDQPKLDNETLMKAINTLLDDLEASVPSLRSALHPDSAEEDAPDEILNTLSVPVQDGSVAQESITDSEDTSLS